VQIKKKVINCVQGVVSPILANMTLDGIEKMLKSKYWTSSNGTVHRKHNKQLVNYTRYADDFIITAKTKETLIETKELLTKFLEERGLTLSEEKTLLTHINDGFDFLGWTIRKFNNKLISRPSTTSFKRITDKTKEIINGHLAKTQTKLITSLNPLIVGWSNYQRAVHAKETFAKLDNRIFTQLWNWALHRHPNKSKRWIKNRYWKTSETRKWIFSDGETNLKLATDTKIIRHRLIRMNANPYLPRDRDYFEYRANRRKKGNLKKKKCRL
jgi:RNA-directed DNA polymerase